MTCCGVTSQVERSRMKAILSRVIGGLLVLIVSSTPEPLLAQQTTPQAQNAPAQTQPSGQNQPLPPPELPENPGRNSTQPSATQAAPPQNGPAPQTAPTPQPSGTAVAPPVQVSGGAASKPAGVAIAPPKQRQVRSLLLKLGLLAGAGAAIGTVVGLSAASPGRVPNSGH
jgi:hypothetical protein